MCFSLSTSFQNVFALKYKIQRGTEGKSGQIKFITKGPLMYPPHKLRGRILLAETQAPNYCIPLPAPSKESTAMSYIMKTGSFPI